MNNVRVSGPLVFTEQNCPSRAGEIINSISEIYDIPNPRVGMLVYVKNEDKNYTITGLREKVIEGVAVPNAQVDTYRCVEAELLNRIQGTSENSDAVRDPFKFLGEFEDITALVTKLDKMTEPNKGYVGIFRATISLRVITIINNPISAGDNAYNQMIIGNFRIGDNGELEVHGQSFNVLYRHSWRGGWGNWQIANKTIIDAMLKSFKAEINTEVENVEAELLKRLQGVSENSDAVRDPFKFLGELSRTKFFEIIDALNGDSVASREECAGHFRATVEHRIVDVYSEQIGWQNNVWVQRMVCPMQLFNEVAQEEKVYTKKGVDKDGNVVSYKYRTHTYTQNFGTLTGASTNQNTVKTYTRTCNKGVWGDWKDVSNNYINSLNYGKRIAFFGGSFAQNMSLTSTPWSFDYQGRTYSLMQYIAEKLGATSFDDYAVGSQGVIVGDIPIIEQLQTAGAGYDIYVIFGGINDFGNSIPLGESNGAADNTTYCGGLKTAFDWIRSKNKSAKIYTVTPFKAYTPDDRYWNPRSNIKKNGHTFYEFIQAQKEVAQIHGVPCFDLWANQQFSGASASEHYYTDLLHPNGKGYQAVADALVEFLAYGLGSGVLDAYAVLPNASAITKGLMSAEDKIKLDAASSGATKIVWGVSSNMNDFKTPGVYDIYGERTVKTDNLPITNDGSGHSISARLTVVASTLQPANNEICVTQFLQLSNRVGGEGATYVRTYNENNNGMNGWSPWQKQMGMVETYMNGDHYGFGFGKESDGINSGVGLHYFIDNGIYSGVYVDDKYISGQSNTPSFIETFVLVVINDYAASGKLNLPRHITQLKYAVDAITGQSTVKKRVGTGNDAISWGDWEDIGGEGSSEVDVTEAVRHSGLPALIKQGFAKEGVTYKVVCVAHEVPEIDNNNKIKAHIDSKRESLDDIVTLSIKCYKYYDDVSVVIDSIINGYHTSYFKYIISCINTDGEEVKVSADMTVL